MNPFFAAIQRFGIGRLAAILGIGAGLAAVAAAITMNLGEPKALLYANLDLKEAGTITQALDQAGVNAINAFMAEGGIVLFDTRDAGSGQGMAAGTETALRRVTQGLSVPPLSPVPPDHVLTRAFYLLTDFPGRWIGGQVWVQRDQDRANDSVSPVIIGGHDWAAAWAVDDAGRNPYAAVPGGARQRLLAYRFGVNLVMYALTGNYKGDQVHVPIILERLGQ